MSVGLLAAILAMLVCWVRYFFHWAFPGPITILLLLVVPMGLLAVILAMLAH